VAVPFTADTHSGHAGALGAYRHPFTGVAAMGDALIAEWNAAVAADDEVYHLGDFAVWQQPARIEALLGTLAGREHLIAGNNECEAITRAAAGPRSIPRARGSGRLHAGRRVLPASNSAAIPAIASRDVSMVQGCDPLGFAVRLLELIGPTLLDVSSARCFQRLYRATGHSSGRGLVLASA
jgi:hypothetical protein